MVFNRVLREAQCWKRKKKGGEGGSCYPLINSTDAEKDRCFPGWVAPNKNPKKSGVTLRCRLHVGRGGKAGASWRRLTGEILRLKRSKRSRIKGLVCVCRRPCLMVQPGFQLISTLKAKVYSHVLRAWKGCRRRLKDQRARLSSI